MSQIFSKSPKHCAKQGLTIDKSYKKLFFASSAFFTTVLAFIFLIWLILHPAKPQFSLREADIYQLKLSGPHFLLNSSIQLTLLCKNPNKKVGIYYEELQAYAAYKGQQITVDAFLPPFYQGHDESNLLTTSLEGTGLPVAPSFGYEVVRDQTAGRIVLNLKVNGKLRWKVGTWVSGRYRFNVNCVSVMAFGPNAPTVPLSSNQGTQCSTAVGDYRIRVHVPHTHVQQEIKKNEESGITRPFTEQQGKRSRTEPGDDGSDSNRNKGIAEGRGNRLLWWLRNRKFPCQPFYL